MLQLSLKVITYIIALVSSAMSMANAVFEGVFYQNHRIDEPLCVVRYRGCLRPDPGGSFCVAG